MIEPAHRTSARPRADPEVRIRADAIRRVLVRTTTIEGALLALWPADHETLCEVAAGYGLWPVRTSVLKERLARSHVLLVLATAKGAAALSTARVTVSHVHDWAQATLRDWLDGHYEFDSSAGGEFRIGYIADEGDRGQVFEVTTAERHDPRRFRVMVVVTEEPAP